MPSAAGTIASAPRPTTASASARGSPTCTYAWSRHSWPRSTIRCFGVRRNSPPRLVARAMAINVLSDMTAPTTWHRNDGTPAHQRRPCRTWATMNPIQGAIAELQVLGERGSAPSAGVVDGLTPPNSRRAGEVGEEASVRAHGLLDEKVEVDGQRLQAREPRVALVEVPPPRLRETDLRVVEDAKDAAEEVAGRHEVGVEDGDERCG